MEDTTLYIKTREGLYEKASPHDLVSEFIRAVESGVITGTVERLVRVSVDRVVNPRPVVGGGAQCAAYHGCTDG